MKFLLDNDHIKSRIDPIDAVTHAISAGFRAWSIEDWTI